jgi:hypothetical protein
MGRRSIAAAINLVPASLKDSKAAERDKRQSEPTKNCRRKNNAALHGKLGG